MKNLGGLHDKLHPVLQQAEKLLLTGFANIVNHRQKLVGQDTMSIVTDTDSLIDNFFRVKLSNLFPDVGFISEELEDTQLKEFNWIIDPIDGTLNFTRKIPIFGISVALWHGNDPIYGYLSLPLVNTQVYGVKGQGLFSYGEPSPKPTHNLTNQPYLYYAHMGTSVQKAKTISMLTTKYNLPRNLSSAIFNGAMTALGKADATVYINQGLWDIAAVWAIIKEAGLGYEFISPKPDLTKNDYRGYQHSLIIGKPELVKNLAKDIRIALG